MRLIHKDPKKYINRTIIFHGRFWLIQAVHLSHIELADHVRQEKGILLPHMWQNCRVFPERQEIAGTFPRLISLLREVCLLTYTEAETAILSYLVDGPFSYGSEAVARIGGTGNAIRRSLMHRHRVRRAKRGRLPTSTSA